MGLGEIDRRAGDIAQIQRAAGGQITCHRQGRAGHAGQRQARRARQFCGGRGQRLARLQRGQRQRTRAIGQDAVAVDKQQAQMRHVDIGGNIRQVGGAIQRTARGVVDNNHRAGVDARIDPAQDRPARQLHRLDRQGGIGGAGADLDIGAGVLAKDHRHTIAQCRQVNAAGDIAGDIDCARTGNRRRMPGHFGGRNQQRLAGGQCRQRDRTGAVGQCAAGVGGHTRQRGQIDVRADPAQVNRMVDMPIDHVDQRQRAGVQLAAIERAGDRLAGHRVRLDRQRGIVAIRSDLAGDRYHHAITQARQVDAVADRAFDIQRAGSGQRQRRSGQLGGQHRHRLRGACRAKGDFVAADGKIVAAVDRHARQLGQIDAGADRAQADAGGGCAFKHHCAAAVRRNNQPACVGDIQVDHIAGGQRDARAAAEFDRDALQRGQIDQVVRGSSTGNIQHRAGLTRQRQRGAARHGIDRDIQRLPRLQRRQRDRPRAVGQIAAAVDRQVAQLGQVDVGRDIGQIDIAAKSMGYRHIDHGNRAGVDIAAVLGAANRLTGDLARLDRQRGSGRGRAHHDMRAGVMAECHRHAIIEHRQVDTGGDVAGNVHRSGTRHGQRAAGQFGGRRKQRLTRGERGYEEVAVAVCQIARTVDSQTRKLGDIDIGGDVAQVVRPADRMVGRIDQHDRAGIVAIGIDAAGNAQTRQLGRLDRQSRGLRCGAEERVCQRRKVRERNRYAIAQPAQVDA